MRRLPIVVLAVCLMAGLVSKSHAAYTLKYSSAVIAAISFTATGDVTASVAMRNMTGDTSAVQLGWSGVTPGGATNWKMSDQYLLLTSNISASNGGVRIFTDNMAGDASPRFTGSTTTVSAAGLIAVESPTADPLPMSWRITDTKPTFTQNPQQGAPGYADRLWDDQGVGTNNQYPCYLWMTDRNGQADAVFNNPALDTFNYRVVKDERGIQHAEATFGAGAPSPDYIFIGAKFSTATTPRTYRTSKLVVEAFME